MMKAATTSRTITSRNSEDLDFGLLYPNCLQEVSNQFISIPCLPSLRSVNFVIRIIDVHLPRLVTKKMRKMYPCCTILRLVLILDAKDCIIVEGRVCSRVFVAKRGFIYRLYVCVLMYYCTSRKRSRNLFVMSVCCGWLSIVSCCCAIICLSLVLMASPLQSVEAITFGNVLGTQKQLIFNLHTSAW